VRAIVENWRLGLSPHQIVEALPYLTLSQVHEAMSYYYDNQDEIDSYIQQNDVPDDLVHPLVRNI